jgi:hypothetical protein
MLYIIAILLLEASVRSKLAIEILEENNKNADGLSNKINSQDYYNF